MIFSKSSFIKKNVNINEKYAIEKSELGSGSFGKVLKAREKVSKELRAIKIIPKIKIKDLNKFMNEIEVMKLLDHPNIVKLYEWYEDENSLYLVMELCSGGDLFKMLSNADHFNEADQK